MSIKLKLTGFNELLEQIEKAEGSALEATQKAMNKSAEIMDSELRKQLSDVTESGLAERMPQPIVSTENNRVSATVGFEKGTYNPNNLSDGYKAAFLNYGTPHRTKHGKEQARNFIGKAKKKATSKIKKAQEETLKDILSELQK